MHRIKKTGMSKEELITIFAILGSLLTGLVIGYIIKGRQVPGIGRILTVLVWVLLFGLGIKVGTDEEVVDKLPIIGMEALFITIGAITGSVFFAWVLWRFLNKRNQN